MNRAAQRYRPYMNYNMNMNNVRNGQSQTSPSYSWYNDLMGSPSSGYGHEDPGGSCFSIDICPDLIIAAITAAAAVAAVAIFNAIGVAAAGKRSFGSFFGHHASEFINFLGNCISVQIF